MKRVIFFLPIPVSSLPLDNIQFYALHDVSPWSGSGNAVAASFCRWGNYRRESPQKVFPIITANLFLSCKMPDLLVWLECQSNGQPHYEQRDCKLLENKKWQQWSAQLSALAYSFHTANTMSGSLIATFLHPCGMVELSKEHWGEQHLCTSPEGVHRDNGAHHHLSCLGPCGRAV